MNQELLERIRQCPTLPSLPAVALEVIKLTRGDATTTNQVADAISRDSALTSKILKTVNSSFYGHRQSISTLRHAVAFLGLESVKSLVLGFTIVRDLSKRKPHSFSHLTYWRRSIYGATAAGILAEKLLQGQQESCFLAGLLMDIGMLVLDRVLGDEYGEVHAKARNHYDLAEVERKELGLTHADAAEFLAQLWNLPESLAVPMARHDRPESVEDRAQRRLAEVAHLAGRCADIFVDEKPAMSIAGVRRICMEDFKISEISCDAMLCSISQRTRELGALFEIPIDASSSYEGILQKANDELLAQTLTAFEQKPQREKRRTPRVKRENAISILPCSAGILGAPMNVRLRDVSSRGIGLTTVQHMARGQQFVVQLPQKTGASVFLLYTVVRCEAGDPGKHIVGAELECILNPDEVAKRQPHLAGALGKISAAVVGS